ncbi:MAG TPA: universal stress protein [Ideonella sp.]|uniref:universal stress protein n=1 Tax=Ideonella sp. TaxID=1929293 RepID=UPI002D034C3C|nr:universal stress protein [Ideonella sp.]HSI49805.1 universal stress protein [Ideonella sp.]
MLKILVAVDGSELSLDAVRHALGLRQQGLAAEFVLANVQEPASLYEMLTMRDPEKLLNVSTGAGEHLLERARQLCTAAGATYECDVESGDPAHMLIDIAERYACDAIVVGARGRGGLGGPMLGSVSQVLAHESPLPVTVVKHMQADDEASREGMYAHMAPPADSMEVVIGLA